jgi:hypothetical protein
MQSKRCRILGKGDKHRSLPCAGTTAEALWKYLAEGPREPSAPVFLSDRGPRASGPLTRWGVRQIVERLGKAAQIESVRCSPRTFRHTFAVSFLRSGGNVFTLHELLGHTDLKMTNKYGVVAQCSCCYTEHSVVVRPPARGQEVCLAGPEPPTPGPGGPSNPGPSEPLPSAAPHLSSAVRRTGFCIPG